MLSLLDSRFRGNNVYVVAECMINAHNGVLGRLEAGPTVEPASSRLLNKNTIQPDG